MFILYALPVGVVAGWLAGGRLASLEKVTIRWAPVALIGLLAQVALFSTPLTDHVGSLGALLYVASSLLVLLVVLRNLAIPGLAVMALGAALNLAAIVANGGYMPVSDTALAALGKTVHAGYSNSLLLGHPHLAPLTDLFALPSWLPFTNIFSVGDVLIGIGLAWAIAISMRRGARGNLPRRSRAVSTEER